MIVFDDYAENIQQNQVKTTILAEFPGFFRMKRSILALISREKRVSDRLTGGRLQTATPVAAWLETPSKTGLSPKSSPR